MRKDIINQTRNATGDIIYRNAKGDIIHRNATGTVLDKTFSLTGYEYSYLIPFMGALGAVGGLMLSKKKSFKGNKKIAVIGGLAVLGLVIASQIQKPVRTEEYAPSITLPTEVVAEQDNMDVEDMETNNLTGDIING